MGWMVGWVGEVSVCFLCQLVMFLTSEHQSNQYTSIPFFISLLFLFNLISVSSLSLCVSESTCVHNGKYTGQKSRAFIVQEESDFPEGTRMQIIESCLLSTYFNVNFVCEDTQLK